MNTCPSIEEVFEVLEDMAAKLKMMQDDNNHQKSWTAEDLMKSYTFVYNHHWGRFKEYRYRECYILEIFDKYKSILRERINQKVVPSLINKNGGELVKEIIQLWSEFKYFAKIMTVLISGLSQRPKLDPQFPSHPTFSNQLFHDLVIVRDRSSLQKSLLILIDEERERKVIDHEMNKKVLEFLAEMKLDPLSKNYCSKFERIMLVETGKCYHQLSLDYHFQPNLFIDYIQKEEERVKAIYPKDNATGRKLLEIQAMVLSDYKQLFPTIDQFSLEDLSSMEEDI